MKKKIGVGLIGASPLFAKDLRDGTHVAPDLAHAVTRHKLMDAIELASRTGLAQKVG